MEKSLKPKPAVFRRIIRIVGKVLLYLFGLLLLVLVAIQLPFIQNWAKNQTVEWLSTKLNARVEIAKFRWVAPGEIGLYQASLYTPEGESWLHIDTLQTDISLWALTQNKVQLRDIALHGVDIRLQRSKDSLFNFDYIRKAFTSDKPKDTTPSLMTYAINRIDLKRWNVEYTDALTTQTIRANWQHLGVDVQVINPTDLQFALPNIELTGLNGFYSIATPSAVNTNSTALENPPISAASTTENSPELDLILERIQINQSAFQFQDLTARSDLQTSIAHLQTQIQVFNLSSQRLHLKELLADGVQLDYVQEKTANIVATKQQPTASSPSTALTGLPSLPIPWDIQIDDLQLATSAIKVDNHNFAHALQGFDANHIALKELQLNLKEVKVDSTLVTLRIEQANTAMQSGWSLHQLSGNLKYTPTELLVDDLIIETPKTKIANQSSLTWPVGDPLAKATVNLHFKQSQVAISDILYWQPELYKQPTIAQFADSVLHLNTQIQGPVNDLTIPTLEISGLGTTRLAGKARIKNLPDIDRLWIDLQLYQLQTSGQDLKRFLPAGTLPAAIHLPPSMLLSGTISGTLNNLKSNLKLRSNWGQLAVNGSYRNHPTHPQYQMQLRLNQLQLQRFMPNSQLGIVDGEANVKGSGVDLNQLNSIAELHVNQVGYNGYTYRDLDLKARVQHREYDLAFVSKDTNAQMTLSSSGVIRNNLPSGEVNLAVDYADLNALGFYTTPLRLRTQLQADVLNLHPDSLHLQGYITRLSVANLTRQVDMDSIRLEALTHSGQSRVGVYAPFLTAEASGAFRYDHLIAAIERTMNTYLKKPEIIAREEEIVPQEMDLRIVGRPHDFWHMVLPELSDMQPFTADLTYTSTSAQEAIVGQVNVPHLHLGAMQVDGLNAEIVGNEGKLGFTVDLDNFENAQLQLHHTVAEGNVVNGVVQAEVGIDDKAGKRQFQLGGRMDLTQTDKIITLTPEGAMLNYENWEIPPTNQIAITDKGIYFNDVALVNANSSLRIQSQELQPNTPVTIALNDFEVGSLTDMILKPHLQVHARTTGEIELRNLDKQLAFVGDLTLNQITFNQQEIGDLRLVASNEVGNRYTIQADLTGFENQVGIEGHYDTVNESLQATVDIEALQLSMIERLLPTYLKDAKGTLSGELTANGKMDAPQLRGGLDFNGVGFTVIPLDTYYEIAPQKLIFDEKGIAFNQFELRDKRNNDLTIHGYVLTTNYSDFGFNLTVNANDFQAIDAAESADAMYYGQLTLDARLTVKGTLETPIVGGSLTVDKGTDFSVVLPQSDPRIADREGIIEFVDKDGQREKDALFSAHQLQEQLNQSSVLQGMDVNVNITVNDEAALSLIIDRSNGDFLELKGEAELNGGIDPSGKVSLTGRYELVEGAYEMSFNFLKRKFNIEKGSYLLWTGEPTTANIEITAVYESLTAPIDLLGNQLGNEISSERNKYRQKLPFQTKLIMKGELMKPVITFDIDLPDKNYGVSSDIVDAVRTKLDQLRQDEAELTKQVFALLVLNRFIGENPFESSSGAFNAETMARQSVSKILSQQLNNMAADFIQGVDLNFDLESTEDYTTGERQNRTDLNVELSKKLMDDRLTISVGSSFGIEGEQQVNQRANTIAGDISASYQLTRDGRYAVRAYRKDEYQVAIQGQVVETGVAFIITMDYEKFVELFHRSREERRMIREENRRKEREAELKKEAEQAEKKAKEEKKMEEKDLKNNKTTTDE